MEVSLSNRSISSSLSEPTCFTREACLRDAISINNIFGDCKNIDIVSRTEVAVGPVIPDIVYVKFKFRPMLANWASKITYRHAHIIHILRQSRAQSIEMLSSKSFESPDRLLPLVKDLVKWNLICQSSRGTYALSMELKTIKAEVISVETKLHKWKDALTQAKSYLGFSNQSVVIMSENCAPTSKTNMQLFKESGVGLCEANVNTIKWIVKPKSIKQSSTNREYLVLSACGTSHTLWSAL